MFSQKFSLFLFAMKLKSLGESGDSKSYHYFIRAKPPSILDLAIAIELLHFKGRCKQQGQLLTVLLYKKNEYLTNRTEPSWLTEFVQFHYHFQTWKK